MLVMPFELRVLPLPSREVESSPSFNLVQSGNLLVAIVFVDFGRHELLGKVSSSLVVQDSVWRIRQYAAGSEQGDNLPT